MLFPSWFTLGTNSGWIRPSLAWFFLLRLLFFSTVGSPPLLNCTFECVDQGSSTLTRDRGNRPSHPICDKSFGSARCRGLSASWRPLPGTCCPGRGSDTGVHDLRGRPRAVAARSKQRWDVR